MRVGWFTSGRGPGSLALLSAAIEATESGRLPIEIAYVFCNRGRGEHEPADHLLDLAESHHLPVVTLSSSAFRRQVGGEVARADRPLPPWRMDYDRAVLDLLDPFDTRVAVLAGYLLIAPELCKQLDLLNLHPAAPGGPAGLWQEVIWQLIEQGADRSGVTIFRATPELDAGPPLSFCTYSLRDDQINPLWTAIKGRGVAEVRAEQGESLPLFAEIRRRGAQRETPLLLATLAALATSQIQVAGGRVLDERGTEVAPLDLSNEVDTAIQRPV
jgi:folate-dependent phosphoribosylglycinamide formyltransferase PurN